MTGTALVPRKRQAASATKAEHLRQAKRDLAEGEKLLRNGMASCRSAAEHIAAAIDQGATQREVAKAIGKSQPWVAALLKWHKAGALDSSGGPFAVASKEQRKRIAARSDQATDQKGASSLQPRLNSTRRENGAQPSSLPTGLLIIPARRWTMQRLRALAATRKKAMRRFSNGLRSDTGDVIRSTASLGRSSLHRLGSVERPIEEVKEAGAALDSAERRKAALTVERDWGEPHPDPVGFLYAVISNAEDAARIYKRNLGKGEISSDERTALNTAIDKMIAKWEAAKRSKRCCDANVS